jgi:Cu(I)/Ag(I) efflux system membrane fusion protein
MEMVKKGGVPAPEAKALYRCPMDGGERDTPGPCPKCGMALGEEHRVKVEAPGAKTIWVCEIHPDHVFDGPGECARCNGMPYEPRKIYPGSKLVYRCPEHPNEKSDQPGKCPKCGKDLGFKVESEASRVEEGYCCPVHAGVMESAPGKCPICGSALEHAAVEEVLAVPFPSVIDTGSKKVVWLDKGGGLFEGVEVRLGPRAGDFYPVLAGLAAGDHVALEGAFLIDAENGLNPSASATYFGASDKPASGGGK